jgi:hypothetical protein
MKPHLYFDSPAATTAAGALAVAAASAWALFPPLMGGGALVSLMG